MLPRNTRGDTLGSSRVATQHKGFRVSRRASLFLGSNYFTVASGAGEPRGTFYLKVSVKGWAPSRQLQNMA